MAKTSAQQMHEEAVATMHRAQASGQPFVMPVMNQSAMPMNSAAMPMMGQPGIPMGQPRPPKTTRT